MSDTLCNVTADAVRNFFKSKHVLQALTFKNNTALRWRLLTGKSINEWVKKENKIPPPVFIFCRLCMSLWLKPVSDALMHRGNNSICTEIKIGGRSGSFGLSASCALTRKVSRSVFVWESCYCRTVGRREDPRCEDSFWKGTDAFFVVLSPWYSVITLALSLQASPPSTTPLSLLWSHSVSLGQTVQVWVNPTLSPGPF